MDLYDVKARAFHSPLNAREIGQLFRTGQLGGQQPCKPKGEAKWRTVDELFPLLKHEATAGPLRFKKPARSNKPILVAWALIGLVLCGILYFIWDPRGSGPADRRTLAELSTSNRNTPGRSGLNSGRAGNGNADSDSERIVTERRQREQTARERAALRH